MSGRVRLLDVQIVPRFVVDDGQSLRALPTPPPQAVPASEWPRVVEHLAKAQADLQAQLDAETPEPDPT